MNVLFIAVDDLRTEIGCYGNKLIKTPNIDKLAAKGTVFNRAYCQQAVCSPSRTSLMTGLRPDSTKVVDLHTHFRSTIPDIVTLPQHFKNNGYYARAFGKIYHGSLVDSLSWSSPNIYWRMPAYASAENLELIAQRKKAVEGKKFANFGEWWRATAGPAYECADVHDSVYNNGKVAKMAIELLESNKIKQTPFFLAVGFYRPHLPFLAPKKYWDLYNEKQIPMAVNPFFPKGMPAVAGTNWDELRSYNGMPKEGDLDKTTARKLKHGYYACVSYTDALIGAVLDALEKEGLSQNTIVVLWGDHGWKLGEHDMWCKHTNFEIDTRAPLVCYAPTQLVGGKVTDALVEFIDVYPSLCELAGLEMPVHLQGKSFAPLMDDPDLPWKDAAISQYPRGKYMGYSMRTNHYRFTQWYDRETGQVSYTELYDHQNNDQENNNVARENPKKVAELSKQLKPYVKFQKIKNRQ